MSTSAEYCNSIKGDKDYPTCIKFADLMYKKCPSQSEAFLKCTKANTTGDQRSTCKLDYDGLLKCFSV